ncbi:MAG: metallophosphoesterase [Acidithiobacillus sp.]|jgi:Icc-related predicted phosphoesterase|nr:metallophosphoesterase [Acidithiobacillus sp.]
MRIAYASDLHLEFDSSITLTGLSSVDVLVLAGDVDTMPEYYTKFLRKLRRIYAGPVLFVIGNHEYYGGIFPDDREKYRDAIACDLQATLLENESITIQGVRFLGATLWTDFASEKQMRNCRRMMSDFQVIESPNGKVITPEVILQVHRDSIAWMDEQFANHHHEGVAPGEAAPRHGDAPLQGDVAVRRTALQGPTVVVTHHAPSFRSQHPRFAGSPISGGFCSNQEHHIQRWKPQVWIHGHVHDPMDYRIGQTRILCNPWGYPNEKRAREYQIVEV